MPIEPDARRAVVFVDGQNLFYAVKEAFGHTFPNDDIPAPASAVCARRGWVNLPDGSSTTVLVGREKGIDVRLALDVVRLAREGSVRRGCFATTPIALIR